MTFTARLIITLFVLVCILGLCDKDRHLDHIGKSEACTGGDLFRGVQAEVLEYGLQDAAGIAADPSAKLIYITEKKRPVLTYDTRSKQLVLQEDATRAVCPDGSCEDADLRDVAVNGQYVFAAEHGKGAVFLNQDRCCGSPEDLSTALAAIRSPSGIAIGSKFLFVADDAQNRECNRRSTELGASVYAIPLNTTEAGQIVRVNETEKAVGNQAFDQAGKAAGAQPTAKPVQLCGDLRRPSGIMVDPMTNRIYVADDQGDVVRWAIFEERNGTWVPLGYLASIPKMGNTSPRFLGITIAQNVIFAAGPGALYAFSREGTSLGRIRFDDTVSGITVAGDAVYVVIGNMLGRIRLSDLHRE